MAQPSGQDPGGIISGINVTPLVDVMLVLLVIFIVTAKIIVTPAVPLDLPHAAHGDEVQVVLSVIVPLQGPLLINGGPVSNDATLTERARAALAGDPSLRAVIQADGAVPHRRIIHVLDLLRGAGLARVAFGALPIEAAATGAVDEGKATP
jgi:biopolymer transport protein TolR